MLNQDVCDQCKKKKISKETTQRKIVISNKTKTTSLMQYSNLHMAENWKNLINQLRSKHYI